MKKFWTSVAVVAVIAAAGWHYRDNIPYLDRVPYLSTLLHHDKAGAAETAEGQPAAANSSRNGNRRNGGGVTVKTIEASMATLPLDVTATGWAVAADTTTIAALVPGLVTSITAHDGQQVKTGDLIASLDDRTARTTIDKDQANIVSDQASLGELDAALKRVEGLVKQNVQSQQTFEQAKAARDSGAAKVDADKATLAADQVALEHTQLRAPYDGRLGDIGISPGAYLSAGSAIVTVTRYDPIYVQFRLSQRYLPQLRDGLKTRVPVDADPAATGGATDRGALSFYDNAVDQASGTVLAKAEFKNDRGLLWPGQNLNVTTHFTSDEETIVVPTVAIRPGADGSFVYTVDAEKKVHVTDVTVLRANGVMTAVASGLTAGDHVVVEGQSQLGNGQTVAEQFSGSNDTPIPIAAATPATRTAAVTQGAKP